MKAHRAGDGECRQCDDRLKEEEEKNEKCKRNGQPLQHDFRCKGRVRRNKKHVPINVLQTPQGHKFGPRPREIIYVSPVCSENMSLESAAPNISMYLMRMASSFLTNVPYSRYLFSGTHVPCAHRTSDVLPTVEYR